jgi:ubiquitin carboxyl-terminal hydrolase 34
MAQDTPDSLTALVGALQQLSQRIPAMAKWNYVPAQDMRSPNGFVGIRNLGCICYMNAMLQQFYMTPTFRYGILMADDGEAPRIEVRASDSAKIDDNVLHQIQ